MQLCLTLINLTPFYIKKLPAIHLHNRYMLDLTKQLLICFVNPGIIKQSKDIRNVDYHNSSNQKSNSQLHIGLPTKLYLASEDLEDYFAADPRFLHWSKPQL